MDIDGTILSKLAGFMSVRIFLEPKICHLVSQYSAIQLQVAKSNPVAIIDLYCTQELSIPAMDQTVADAAFPRAEELIMVSHIKRCLYCHCLQ